MNYLFCIESVFAGLAMVTTALRVELTESEITLELLTKACSFFVKRHPLLQATIQRQYSDDKQFLYKHASQFVQMTDTDDPFAFKNVELIHTNDADKWRQVVELEMQTPLDLHNGPLWRLKVVKSSPCCYHFVWLVHHAITDGLNNTMFVEYLNIVGALVQNTTCVEMSDEVIDSPLSLDDYTQAYVDSPAYKRSISNLLQLDDFDRQPRSVGNTLDGSETRFEYVALPRETLAALLARMKERTGGVAKLTGLVETVFCLAYKQTLATYGEHELARHQPLQYLVQCSARNKLNIGISQMGCFAHSVSVHFNGELPCKSNDPNDLLGNDVVWTLAAKQSRTLHERLDRDEEVLRGHMFAKAMQGVPEKVPVKELYAGTATTSTTHFIVLSSTGVLVNARSPSLIKATDICVTVPSWYRNQCGGFMFVRVTTIDGRLCLSMSYNERVYRREFMAHLSRLIVNMIDNLVA